MSKGIKIDVIKKTAIKNYLKKQENIRSSKEAIELIVTKFTDLIMKLLKSSITNAKEKKRNTVLEEDIQLAITKVIAREDLMWDEILNQILIESPADLGKISRGILKEVGEE